MLPSLWLLVGSDRPTDQGTDRQCQLLSCPGQLKRSVCHNWRLNYLLHQFLWPFQVWHKHSTNIAGRKQRKSEWIVRLREVSDFWGSSCFLKDSKWHWIVGCRCCNATFPLVVMMWYNCHSQIDSTSSISYLYLASCRKQTFLWYQTDCIVMQKLFYTWMKHMINY